MPEKGWKRRLGGGWVDVSRVGGTKAPPLVCRPTACALYSCEYQLFHTDKSLPYKSKSKSPPPHSSTPNPSNSKNTNKHNMSLYHAPLRLATVSLLISVLLSFPVKTHRGRQKEKKSNFYLFRSSLNKYFLREGRSSPLAL